MIEVVADIVGDVGDASSLPAAPERNMTAPVEPWYSCSTVRFCECISTAHRSRAAAGERAPPRARGRCMRRERTCVLVGLQALRRGWPPPDALAHGPRPTRYCRQAAPPHQAQAASWQAQLSCDWACEPLHEIMENVRHELDSCRHHEQYWVPPRGRHWGGWARSGGRLTSI